MRPSGAAIVRAGGLGREAVQVGGSWGGAAGTPSGWGAGVVVEGCRGYPAGLSSARLPLRRPTRSPPCVLQLVVLRCSSGSRDPALVQLPFRVTSYPLSCRAPRGTLAPGPSPRPQGRQLSLPSRRRPAPTLTPGPRERGGSGAPARPRLPVSALQPELPGGEGHRPRLRTPSSDRRGLGRPGPRRLRHHRGAGPFPGQVSCRWTRLHGDPCSRGAWGSGHARRSALAFADRLADLGQQARLPPIRPGGAPQGVAWRVPTSAGQGREISLIGGDVVSGGAGLPALEGVPCPSHGPGGKVAGSLGQGPGRARRGGQQDANRSAWSPRACPAPGPPRASALGAG